MTINCNCPSCGSRNTKSLSIIFESGQRHGRATRNSLWASLSGAVLVGRSTTSSHSSSLLANSAAPPPGQFPWPIIGWPLFIGVIFFKWSVWIIPMVMFGVAILYGGSEHYNLLQKERAIWQQTFRCLRCGKTFLPNDYVQASD